MYIVSNAPEPNKASCLVLGMNISTNKANSIAGRPYPKNAAKSDISGLSTGWLTLFYICRNLYADVYSHSSAIRYKKLDYYFTGSPTTESSSQMSTNSTHYYGEYVGLRFMNYCSDQRIIRYLYNSTCLVRKRVYKDQYSHTKSLSSGLNLISKSNFVKVANNLQKQSRIEYITTYIIRIFLKVCRIPSAIPCVLSQPNANKSSSSWSAKSLPLSMCSWRNYCVQHCPSSWRTGIRPCSCNACLKCLFS